MDAEMIDRLRAIAAMRKHFRGSMLVRADFEAIEAAIAALSATPQAATGYIVDAVAWESFVADYSRYVDGKRDTPFVSIREGLAAVIDSARPATPQAAQVPAALRDTVDAIAYALDEWLGPLSAEETQRACEAIHSALAAAQAQGVG